LPLKTGSLRCSKYSRALFGGAKRTRKIANETKLARFRRAGQSANMSKQKTPAVIQKDNETLYDFILFTFVI
jgi:hypothetical protein